MPDYKEMYLTMVRETEKAITILEEVERSDERRGGKEGRG